MNSSNPPSVTRLQDYTPPPFLIEHAQLEFILEPNSTMVRAKLDIRRNPQAIPSSSPLILDGVNLELQTIQLDQRALQPTEYQITDNQLLIPQVPDHFILETLVTIHPEQNLSCNGLYLSNGIFCTQNEPHGFRTITYFLDRPDVLTKFTTAIRADAQHYPTLLSNGNLVHSEEFANGQQLAIWQDPFPKSAYLFALVAGKLSYIEDHHLTNSGRQVKLRIFTTEAQLSQTYPAMQSLKQAMEWDEQNFGLEYDLDLYQIVAVDDFNFGAMENKGLNIFNSKLLLASPDTATDEDFQRIAAVVAHEYFHNWTGNRVTCRDWFQIGLKEGLTTLREQLFMEDLYDQGVQRINSIKIMQERQFAEDASPLAHPVRLQQYIEVNNFYTTTVYEKSAEIARMLLTIFGRTTFRKILEEFLQRKDGQPATIEDFIQVAAHVTQHDLSQFQLWYDQAGTPQLTITDNFDLENQRYTLTIDQKPPPSSPQPLYIPFALGLIDPDTGENLVQSTIIIDHGHQHFEHLNQHRKPLPSLLRNFSAPIKIDYAYTDEELNGLAHHDQDPINRWEAAQKLMTRTILANYRQPTNPDNLSSLLSYLTGLITQILASSADNPLWSACMLRLPTASQLLAAIEEVDVVQLHHAREKIKTTLAQRLESILHQHYIQNQLTIPYQFDLYQVGQRSLKNVTLHYLIQLPQAQYSQLAYQQLTTADNLTDRYAALTALAYSAVPEKDQLLNNYYDQWKNYPNLVNKWLALNASIPSPDNLVRIQQLTHHPSFNLQNPNKVYALLRNFAENNPVGFHTPNGDAYQFLAEQILKIDRFNPQLAANLATPLTRGYQINLHQRQLMHRQLEYLLHQPQLSPNLYEILDKATRIAS